MVANDECKLFINNRLLVEPSFEWNPKPTLGEIELEKDKQYDIRIDYVEKKNEAKACPI